ncbi:type II secretion system inner membrane protein GspF [Woodsholea maritima]|uniref:type II secretion system inner membrane protein GspF n=1 Tax=Woodsholea maritima TaxID=240237 RepID=UPI00037EA282|nr:type II secretion system inner membrane protein GspF [Woodsholea maritima]
MPAFEYEALDAAGAKTKGLLSADSDVGARRELRRRKLTPLKLNRVDERRSGEGAKSVNLAGLLSQAKLSEKELMGVTRQLSTLINAGMPVEEALGMVSGQMDRPNARKVLMNVRGRVSEGERLSEAMGGYEASFPGVYRAMISAGEGTGGLGAVLDRLSDYLEKAAALRQRIQVALIYPCVLGVVALLVVSALLVFVVPRIAEQFTTLGVDLPGITQFMIALSGFMQAHWSLVGGGLLVLILIFILALRRPAIKKRMDGFVQHIPGFGGFSRKIESARFARTMAILINAGAVLPDALRAARRASANGVFQDRIAKIINEVETGRALSDALKGAKWFPPLMLYMIAAGERSGRLDEMFEKSADHIDNEVDSAVSVGLSLLEPGIIVIMGGVVAMIVLSILLPILKLNSLVLG